MYRLQYAEVCEDDQAEARDRERIALDHSIALLEKAQTCEPGSAEVAQAIFFTTKLWTLLLEDLANPENGLPKELRAQLISIGIWILRELESVRTGKSANLSDLLEVSNAIRAGIA
jgi:flagellar protein FlaF